MSWVTSAIVHTSMLVVLGSALTAFPVVAPEVPGNRIVVMSSMADVAAPESAHSETKPVVPIHVAEMPDVKQPPGEDLNQSPEVEESTPELSPQPLELPTSPMSVPAMVPRRRLDKSRSKEAASTNSPKRQERERVHSSVSRVDLPSNSRLHPEATQTDSLKPVEVPAERRRAPAEIQPRSASTARQQSSNSVSQTVGTTPTKPARPISNPNPMYPAEAVQRGLEGRVILSVTIATSGAVTKVTIAESCGHKSLDRAALDAVRRWRFSPATRGGKPVEWTARLPIRFRL